MLDYFVHKSSYVDDKAIVGSGTKIWHFSHVMAGARIGKNCTLGQNVFIGSNVVVGDGCKIQNNVSLYKGVVLEDDVFVGPSVVFTNVVNPRAFVERKDQFQQIVVRMGSTIGANSTIICGVELGKYCFVAAGSVVTKDVPAFALIMGVPARFIKYVDMEMRQ